MKKQTNIVKYTVSQLPGLDPAMSSQTFVSFKTSKVFGTKLKMEKLYSFSMTQVCCVITPV